MAQNLYQQISHSLTATHTALAQNVSHPHFLVIGVLMVIAVLMILQKIVEMMYWSMELTELVQVSEVVLHFVPVLLLLRVRKFLFLHQQKNPSK